MAVRSRPTAAARPSIDRRRGRGLEDLDRTVNQKEPSDLQTVLMSD
jgi:hypothetical protein